MGRTAAVVACAMVGVCVAGCVRTAPQPVSGYWVSSDSSGYTPVARFRVYAHRANGRVDLSIDSGSIAIPGPSGVLGPPLMDHLYVTAILAVGDSGTFAVVHRDRQRGSEDRRGWRPLAESDSAPLVAQLRFGERARVPELRLAVPVTSRLPDVPLWMIFRISGNAVYTRAPLAPGATPRTTEIPGAVDVYVCGDRDVFGRLDEARAAMLKRAYGIAC